MITVVQLLGGKGTRLKEKTKGLIPKPLVEINGISILEHQIKHFVSFGCKDFVWICHFMSDDFKNEKIRLLEKYKEQIDTINIFIEKYPLSTFGNVFNSIKKRTEDKYLVIYGDIIVNFDLYRFVKDFDLFSNSDTHIFTRFSDHPEDSDKIEIDDNGYVSKFISKKEPSNEIDPSTTTSGIYLAKRSFFEKLSHWASQKCDLYSEVLPKDGYLINASSYQSSEFILDVGTIKRFYDAERILQDPSFYKKSYLFPKASLLLDRDGVIIKENGYLTELDQIIFNNELIEILKYLKSKNVLVGIITNQPHVSQGRINDYKHNLIKNFIVKYLSKSKAIDFYFECKHYPDSGFEDEVPYYKDACYCRKPRTGLLQKAIHHHNIDIDKSFFIGDKNTDFLAGNTSLIKSFIYEFGSKNSLQGDNKFNVINNLEEIKSLFNN